MSDSTCSQGLVVVLDRQRLERSVRDGVHAENRVAGKAECRFDRHITWTMSFWLPHILGKSGVSCLREKGKIRAVCNRRAGSLEKIVLIVGQIVHHGDAIIYSMLKEYAHFPERPRYENSKSKSKEHYTPLKALSTTLPNILRL